MGTLMNMPTNTIMSINTNMIIRVQRMSMTMSTPVNTDPMTMVTLDTMRKNIHTIIN
jgi:hypothetical protein